MTHEQFFYWIKGVFDGKSVIGPDDIKKIRNKINEMGTFAPLEVIPRSRPCPKIYNVPGDVPCPAVAPPPLKKLDEYEWSRQFNSFRKSQPEHWTKSESYWIEEFNKHRQYEHERDWHNENYR